MLKKALIIANNNNWMTWDQKISGIKEFYAPILSLEITVVHTTFTDIPLVNYSGVNDGSSGSEREISSFLVSKDWYAKYIIPVAQGYDFVLFCLAPSDISTNLVPWGAETVDITIFGGNENDGVTQQDRNGVARNLGNSFVLICCHEISHGLYALFSLTDNTHYYFYGANPGGIFNDLNPAIKKMEEQTMSYDIIIAKLKAIYKQYFTMQNVQTPNSLKVYTCAKEAINATLVPANDDPELGCAISVSVLIREKAEIDIKETVSTAELLQELIDSPKFVEVQVPLAGDIVVAATGTSKIPNTPVPHGHTGICAYYGIISNDSSTGLMGENYTLDSWKQRYDVLGGYTSRFFRAV